MLVITATILTLIVFIVLLAMAVSLESQWQQFFKERRQQQEIVDVRHLVPTHGLRIKNDRDVVFNQEAA